MPKIKNSEILSFYQELVKVKREIKDLESREKILKFALINAIPTGKSKGGILHTTKKHTSVAWKDIADLFYNTLIPRGKLKAAGKIIEENRKTTWPSSFKEEK